MNPKEIDAENEEFYRQSIEKVEKGEYSIKEILGIDLKSPTVFIPRVNCRFIAPSGNITKNSSELSAIFSLAPVYDTVICPIRTSFLETKVSESNFKVANGISLEELITFIERGRVIPYFEGDLQYYDQNLIKHFLEPGLPRFSRLHIELVRKHNLCGFASGDCKKCASFTKSALKDIRKSEGYTKSLDDCAPCLSSLYLRGLEKRNIPKDPRYQSLLCALVDIITATNMGAVYKSSCITGKNALSAFSQMTQDTETIEAVVTGLKVKYSPELELESYLELLDGKTTRAIREIINRVMQDPFATKYSERLNAKIFEFNREIEEVGKSRVAKFYQAVSDIAVCAGSRYIESQAQSIVRINKNNKQVASEWIASKLVDAHARVTGKNWAFVQLYKVRCKIEKCKKNIVEGCTKNE